MTAPAPMDILLGIGFGETLPNNLGVLATLLIRTSESGELREGIRPPISIPPAALEELAEKLPRLLPLLREQGFDSAPIPPAQRPIPWNEGPTIDEAERAGSMVCTKFAFARPTSEHAGPIAFIEVAESYDLASPRGSTYLAMPYRAVVELANAIPKVLRLIKEGGTSSASDGLDFDFTRLNFKWDQKTKKVTMNRGYLSVFLRSQGVETMPGMDGLMDLIPRLYILHIQSGRERLPPLEEFLAASGIKIDFHDPATITPARRAMDNGMDALHLDARMRIRDAQDPTAFWAWFDGELAPIQRAALDAGEATSFEARYANLLQLLKDAGMMRSH